jgi:hypothetical protein
VSFEDARTDAAIAATADEIRADAQGRAVRTEFSSSTGGQTAPSGGFPPVVDEGDKTSANPHSTWSVTLTAARLEAGRKLGAFRDIEVTLRDGVGPYGGRVQNLVLIFERGRVPLKSGEFLRAYNLRSVLFKIDIVDVGGSPSAAGSPPPLETIPDDGTTGGVGVASPPVQDAGPPVTDAPPTTVKGKAAKKPPTTKPVKPSGTASVSPVGVGNKSKATIEVAPSTVAPPTTKPTASAKTVTTKSKK